MSSRCPERRAARPARLLGLACLLAAGLAAGAGESSPALRVCADPDNPPFSQRDEGGFENRIARLLADDLQRPLHYTWLRDRRGFVRKTVGADLCDIVVGVPVGFQALQTTAPYYRSAFFFVNREGAAGPTGFTDARLPSWRIGVQLIGIDPGTSPVGYALARHGATERVVGYTLAGAETPPAQRMVQDVASGRLDSALVWGPQAGYFASRSQVPLHLVRAEAPPDMASVPFEFSIAMGVRHGDTALRQSLDEFIARRRADIDAVLAAYRVARTDRAEVAP
ncbi:quinoprotein dehydrogenase-associated putative ABC transporter substrate-binding protein [Variovorax sp. W2I14]|uniref:quinoprotein dehydrogenase-associated putative ABC transporter substrate-binding protein n=1 Tax=Variovorax sp. W2I14 TaxID=3042290 RepID=UPI003D1B8D20